MLVEFWIRCITRLGGHIYVISSPSLFHITLLKAFRCIDFSINCLAFRICSHIACPSINPASSFAICCPWLRIRNTTLLTNNPNVFCLYYTFKEFFMFLIYFRTELSCYRSCQQLINNLLNISTYNSYVSLYVYKSKFRVVLFVRSNN